MQDSEIRKALSQRIGELHKKQKELCNRIGVSFAQINKYRAGTEETQ